MDIVDIDLDPEEPALNGRHLDTLIQLWLDDCYLRLPEHTVDGYADKVRYFRNWWTEHGPQLHWQLKERDLQQFVRDLDNMRTVANKPLMYNTKKDIVRRLRTALLWANRTKKIRHLNVASWLPKEIEGSTPVRVVAPISALRHLMDVAAQGIMPLRDRAILAVLIGTGVRRAECSSICVEDIQVDADGSGTFRVKAKKVRNREIHERHVAFDHYTGRYIRQYLDSRVNESGPLFVGTRGPLTAEGIYKIVTGLIARAGLTGQVRGCHDLRRAFVTTFARLRPGEGHYHLLKLQIGHAPQGTTGKHYDLRDIEDVREVIVSPFALMEITGK